MGLDVYLSKSTIPAAEFVKRARAASRKGKWDVYEALSNAHCVPHAAKDLKSSKHPEHLYQIAYWRSSYNPGGVNFVMRAAIGEDLYSIAGFSDTITVRDQVPDWAKTRDNAFAALAKRREVEAKRKLGTEPTHPSYFEALEVVAETCEWVLSQPDADRFFLVWSG